MTVGSNLSQVCLNSNLSDMKRLFSPGGSTAHVTQLPYIQCDLYPAATVLGSCCRTLQSALKADPHYAPQKGSRLTTDLESDYSHKGNIRGNVTTSGVSVVKS